MDYPTLNEVEEIICPHCEEKFNIDDVIMYKGHLLCPYCYKDMEKLFL